MKFLSTLALILALPLFAVADEPAINTLTPKEIADGWILLFDGKTTFGWTSPNDSKWTITDGILAPQKGKPGSLVTTTAFGDYAFSLEYQVASEGKLEVLVQSNSRGDQPKDQLRYRTRAGNGWWVLSIFFHKGVISGSANYPVDAPLQGRKADVRSDEGKNTTQGHIALSGNGFVIRNIKLTPWDTKQLFNGKDLDGWNAHPNRKSKFGVTKEGFLSVKDGPGDLQTTGEWADFILQAECKTNGKNLNSGIFFRCLPGQYQMGYEAQIHNGFGPEKDYTLELFDPKTNKLVEKKKASFTATDYGTGAIYRRMPARFQAAKDNEWFTMTVAAQGRHLATWVNGMQTVDWTDNRPLEENARKGAYLKKGPISIQGHDPTTDLLFRNFRIAELPADGK